MDILTIGNRRVGPIVVLDDGMPFEALAQVQCVYWSGLIRVGLAAGAGPELVRSAALGAGRRRARNGCHALSERIRSPVCHVTEVSDIKAGFFQWKSNIFPGFAKLTGSHLRSDSSVIGRTYCTFLC